MHGEHCFDLFLGMILPLLAEKNILSFLPKMRVGLVAHLLFEGQTWKYRKLSDDAYEIVETPAGVPTPCCLKGPFDRIVCISLRRREDRRERLLKHLKEIGWPWAMPTFFYAVDGRRVPLPEWWTAGPGAWGCMQSHRQVLEQALTDGVKRLLVLEDDVFFVEDFAARAAEFMAEVPDDWEQIMFGGQFHDRGGTHRYERVSECVYGVAGAERTHAYAVQGPFIADLYAKWTRSSGHCDHVMGPFQHGRRVFAPRQWIAGQAEGKSDIGNESSVRRWVSPDSGMPVTWITGPDPLRAQGYHSGGWRNEKGVCRGLAEIAKMEFTKAVTALKRWVGMIRWEAASPSPELKPAIWCPEMSGEVIRAALGESLVVLGPESAQAPCEKPECQGTQKPNVGRVIPYAPQKERDARLDICEVCEFKSGETCAKDGAVLVDKVRVQDSYCAAGRWFGLNADPKQWGPAAWRLLFATAGKRGLSEAWLRSDFLSRIRCADCRAHYLAFLETHPLGDDHHAWAAALRLDVDARMGRKAETSTELVVFWHVAAMNHWQAVVEEQLDLLAASDLRFVRCTFLGQPQELEALKSMADRHGITLHIEQTATELEHCETFAMLAIERWAVNNTGNVLYFHTKGVSAPWCQGKEAWREQMQREVIAKWRENLAHLSDYDLVGCNWNPGDAAMKMVGHMAGNFWMARADYVRTLPSFMSHYEKNPCRFACEDWIGRANPRQRELASWEWRFR